MLRYIGTTLFFHSFIGAGLCNTTRSELNALMWFHRKESLVRVSEDPGVVLRVTRWARYYWEEKESPDCSSQFYYMGR